MNNQVTEGLAADLPPWPVEEPTEDFAARVAERWVNQEQGQVAAPPTGLGKPRRRRGRAIVIPLLAAAVFSSAAAAAGWGIWTSQSRQQAASVPTEAPERHYELPKSPTPASGTALSEPEGERIELLEPSPAVQKPAPPQPSPALDAKPTPPPGPVKSPPCHCTTGAAICSCFD